MTDTPHSLIERLLTEDGKPDGSRARLMAELAARMGGDGHPSEVTPEMMATRLDGTGTERQGEADAMFAASPEALHDLASAAAFMDAVHGERKTAPADLVAAAVATGKHRKAAPPVRRPWLRWQLIGAGIGLALAALATILVVGHQAEPVDPKAPLMAKPEAPAEAPKLAQPKAKEPQAMMPAGSEDVAPTRKQAPKFAPETPDVAPGR